MNVKEIVEIMEGKDFYHLGGASNESINDAENALDVIFSQDYRDCILHYGAFSFQGHEFVGITQSTRLNVVDVTRKHRERNSEIEKGLYVIEELGIDHIVIWQSSDGSIYQTVEQTPARKIYNSLLEYIKEISKVEI